MLVVLALAVLAGRARCRGGSAPAPLRIATWNIEDFPKDQRQVDAAFAELAALDASFIAVQEITDPALFEVEARLRLGGTWTLATADTRPVLEPYVDHHIGVLFDQRRWTLRSIAVLDDTRAGRQKPALEVRLAPAGGGTVVRVLVVHFKSGGEHVDTRAAQLRGLAAILARVQRSGDHVVVLGDFNATGDVDRRHIAEVARAAGMTWATEGLACSAFWRRADGCPRSRLDHVLTWTAPAAVAAMGECARAGCDATDRCPLYAREVSDHCPVVVSFD